MFILEDIHYFPSYSLNSLTVNWAALSALCSGVSHGTHILIPYITEPDFLWIVSSATVRCSKKAVRLFSPVV